jgi:glycogen debranching enzyme
MIGDTEASGSTWFQAPSEGGQGLVTLVEGNTFCLAGRSADIHPGRSEGLFFLDTRLLSRLELLVDGRSLEPLSVQLEDPFSAVHIGRARPEAGEADAPVAVTRHRYVGRGMRDDIEIHNYDTKPTECEVFLSTDADFANLFAVKGGLPNPGRGHSVASRDGAIEFTSETGEPVGRVRLEFDPVPDFVDGGSASWRIALAPGSSWKLCIEVGLWIGEDPLEPSHPCGTPVHHGDPATRLAVWRGDVPNVDTDHAPLASAVRQAAEDLGALRIFDPVHPDRVVVAAGAPWFMTLFGRDSLLTSWMALVAAPNLARGVLETLADLQGTKSDPETEEQPGRILHEVRFDKSASLSLGGGQAYYGSIDATPLFVMLAGELLRWGEAGETVLELIPSLDRAISWIEDFGDRDGDGYVEYERLTPDGLLHQGWKDSPDGVRFADGRVAEPPIALCEVQGYTYAAYLARAGLADVMGESEVAQRCRERALALERAFNQDFWSEELDRYVMALDCEKRQVDALASNIGHCLWTGIVDEERAASVARDLLSPEMFSGWGVRTLACSQPGYNPVSYHCGSVWPHDTAVAAAGLRRYGFVDEANHLTTGLLDLAVAEGGRLPELVAGFSRDEFREPVPYPTSCSPQAWAAASPLLLLRGLLGLEPDIPSGVVRVDPGLPQEMGRLRVEGIPLADRRLSIVVEDREVTVEGVPSGARLALGAS